MEHSKDYATTLAVPSFLWTPSNPGLPQKITPKGRKGTQKGVGASSRPSFVSTRFGKRPLAALITAIAVSDQNGLNHNLCKNVLPMKVDAPARLQSVTECGLYPSRTQEAPTPSLTASRPPPRVLPL